jgi:hypothetical protein
MSNKILNKNNLYKLNLNKNNLYKLNSNIKSKYFVYLLIIYLIILSFSGPRYYYFLPTIPFYPNNYEDVKNVQSAIKTRTQKNIEFYRLTDSSVVHAFTPYVDESVDELNKMISSFPIRIIVMGAKYFFNRARPYQIQPDLDVLSSLTAHTPAFPAGHAFQAYYLAKKMTYKYPENKKIFEKIAEECDNTRIKAGLHFPSDGIFSRYLVDLFLDWYI